MANRTTHSRKTAPRPKHPPTDHARNYAQIAYEFARDAKADRHRRRHCKWVRLAAKRYLEDLKKQRLKAYPYRFDPWYANDICDFAEKFPHVEGSWSSETITLEPAQIFILACAFGWRRKSDDGRRFSRVYIEMARKGAKSTLSAIVSHYCMACDGEVGPQCIVAATTGLQADKAFLPAKKMAQRTPEYRQAFGIEVWAHSISCEATGGFIQTINSKSSTQDGWNPHLGVLDELHAHKDRGLYDVIRSSAGSRRNYLLWIITTAGYNVEGVCYEQRTLVTKILEGVIEADHYFGVIFTLDEKDKPLDESKWVKANPLIGITPSWEAMREYAQEARVSPDSMGEFQTKRLNIWTSAKHAWLNMEQWWACKHRIAMEAVQPIACWGGLDLASVSDITAFVLVWLYGDYLKIWGRYYLPEETVWPRTERGNVPYKRWADEGRLIVTPGEVTDYDFVRRDIETALGEYDIQAIGYDPWNATHVVSQLLEAGAPMVEMRQGGKTFHPPMMEFERLLKSRKIDHGDDPVLAWAASNIVTRRDVNMNMSPDKKKSHEKIDPIVSALMGLGLALANDQPQSSPWDDPDYSIRQQETA